MPLERWYVDAGSPLYVEVMNKVPVVVPKDLAFVDKTVRETSLRRMVAEPAVSPAPADDEADSAAASAEPASPGDQTGPTPQELLQSVKRRRLYRRATGEEVVWFPHDNHTALMKELVWEAGGNHVKWVFYGTPAAGNGVLGVLEMGCSVICFCEDSHHKEHFLKTLEQKAVENFLLGSSNVFGDADLLAKAQKYVPRPEPKKKAKDDKEDKKEGKDDKEDKKEGKKTSKNKQRSEDDTSDEDEKNKTKKKKKAKKTASGAPKREKKEMKEKEPGEDADSEDSASASD